MPISERTKVQKPLYIILLLGECYEKNSTVLFDIFNVHKLKQWTMGN